jgi:hypothetical protein
MICQKNDNADAPLNLLGGNNTPQRQRGSVQQQTYNGIMDDPKITKRKPKEPRYRADRRRQQLGVILTERLPVHPTEIA